MQEQMNTYKVICKKLIENGLALEELNNYDNFKNVFSENEFKNIIKTKQNRKNKRYRTKSKFLEIYKIYNTIKDDNKKIIFGTITLNNNYLNKKEDTYIRLINKWLKEHFLYSILNKDYGTKNEREHYHFIGLTTEEIEKKNVKSKKGLEIYELRNKNYKMGFEPTLCLIDLNINDMEKTINYLLKLNNHSNKITSKNRIRIIKNTKCELIILYYGINSKKKYKKLIKNNFKNEINFPSYDTLNKRSVSDKELKEISINDFISYLNDNKNYNEL